MAQADDDTELVAAALDDAPGARRRLARRLVDVIHGQALASLRRHPWLEGRDVVQEARDLVQDVLVMLLEHDARELRRWDPARGRTLDNFVRLVARRRIARGLSRRRGNPWSDLPYDPQTLEDEPAQDARAVGLAAQLERRDELGMVLDALYARMSARDLELFDRLFVREQEPREVAQQLGMTRQAVNAWSYRTRRLARSIVVGAAERPGGAEPDASTRKRVDHG